MKKGFTLIELLAVIVILAIIAVIAVPIVINIISETKKSASLRSAEFYLDAVEYAVARSTLNNIKVTSGTYPIMEDGNVCLGEIINKKCTGDILKVEVKGEMPTGGEVNIDVGQIKTSSLTYKNETIVKNISGNLLNITESMKEGALAYEIIKSNGGITDVKTLKSEFYLNDESDGIYLEEGYSYTFGTGYKIDKLTGQITLTGNLVQATPEECINGTKICGKYTIEEGPNEFINRLKEIDSFNVDYVSALSGTTYHTGNDFVKMGGINNTGMYRTIDNLGYSYIFRGRIENYVQFGKSIDESKKGIFIYLGAKSNILSGPFDTMAECENYRSEQIALGGPAESLACAEYTGAGSMIWKVVRINGDGTIRLIYVGVTSDSGFEVSTLSKSSFNPIGNVKYAGYTYNENGVEKDSTIKAYLDNWYTENLEKYSKYIADGQFCNDKTLGNLNNNAQYFSVSGRYYNPTLVCSNEKDLYSVSSNIGNGLLKKPIGLLTKDEIYFSGFDRLDTYFGTVCDEFENCVEFDEYWTMSPDYYLENNKNVYNLTNYEISSLTNVERAVRPVINLKADVKFTGTGTFSDPYVVITE